MTETVEQRIKPTIIRRRAKQEDPIPPPTSTPTAVPSPADTLKAQKVQLSVEQPLKPPAPQDKKDDKKGIETASLVRRPLTTQELEDRFKKAAKKKLSKAEMEFEAIKRAGGLKHFVQQVAVEEVKPEVADRVFEPGPRRKKKQVRHEFKKTRITEKKATKKVIKIVEGITVSELSQAMGVKNSDLVKKLMALGMMVTVNQTIDIDTASLLAQEYDYSIEKTAFDEGSAIEESKKIRKSNIAARAPVVTVMGHVDHGKTSVLDYIRKTKVAAGEAGGITQHMGAYTVTIPKGKITFIDTPGHAAFTEMRARGARVTDLVVLVVAADDGVMPQTKEAIDHARAAEVPIIVAINKIDKPEANLDRAKRSLSEYGVITEEWGGDTICVGTSARTGAGIDQLLEMILLQAEMMELDADSAAPAKGTIIESRLDRGRGPVATLLVSEGTIKVGAPVVCGLHYGRVRALINDHGESVESAGPSEPVELIGLSGVPVAGDELCEVNDDKLAKVVSERRQERQRTATLAKISRVTLEDLQRQIAEEGLKELSIVLKTDVHGSVEAIKEAVLKLSTDKVRVSVLHAGVGTVTESDVMLATAGRAIIIGFNVVPEANAMSTAEQHGVEIRRYSIIYELLDDIKKAMEGLLSPLFVEKVIGHAEVRQIFNISKIGTIAGSMVKDGKFLRTAKARLVRDGAIVHQGKISSLKRFKDDVKEVLEGYECGISLENYNDIKMGDVVEAYIVEEIAQKL